MAKTAKPAPKIIPAVKETKIKYADKSAGQPGLISIFDEIVKLLLPYQKGTMRLRGGKGGQVGLVSEKNVEIKGKRKDEVWFAGALIQKGYVGFYYTPVYLDPAMKKILKPELLKCLKGKTCFYIRKYDAEIFRQIKDALKEGYGKYKEMGWV